MRHSKTPRALAVLFSILLAGALLPACGKKSVRSDGLVGGDPNTEVVSASPTVTPNADLILSEFATNSDVAPQAAVVPTLTPVPQDFAHVPDSVSMEPNPDMEEAKLKKKARPLKSLTLKIQAAEPTPTSEPTVVTAEVVAEPATLTAAPIKVDNGGSDATPSTGISWMWWLLLLIIAAVIGWYFWDRHKEHSSMGLGGPSLRPAPPLGGLSPVSGYFASKKAAPRARSAKKRKR